MRKKGENSFKCAGKSAFPPDENNDFTLGVESQSAHLADSLPDCSVEALRLLVQFVPHCPLPRTVEHSRGPVCVKTLRPRCAAGFARS